MNNQVRVEIAGNRILLESDMPTPGLKETIPGAYFRKDHVWSVPLDLTVCVLLRERFGNRLVIGPGLSAWARAEKEQRALQQRTSAADDAELDLLPTVAPRLFEAMSTRRYQKAAIAFIKQGMGRDGVRRALVADTVGLGKTLEAIGGVLETGQPGPYIVVCPKTAVENAWAPEIRQWLGKDAELITLPEGKTRRQSVLQNLRERYRRNSASLARTWIVVHPVVIRTQTWWICGQCGEKSKYKAGMVQELDVCGHTKERNTKVRHDHEFPHLFEMQYGAVVADESDQILIRLTATPNLQRRGMEMIRDRVRPGGARIAMSGTPFRSKPQQIWSTLNWLDPVRWSAKWSFLEKFWEVRKGGYGGSFSIGELREDREEMLTAELSDVMIRRTRVQVRGDLPAKIYPSNVQDRDDLTPGIYLPMTAKQRDAYESMSKEGEALIEGGSLTAVGVLAEMTRMKQFAGASGRMEWKNDGKQAFKAHPEGNKYEWLLEFLLELGFPDAPATKLVVASQFTDMLEAFAKGMAGERSLSPKAQPLRYAMITGNVSGPQRERNIADFENAKSGLNLLFINTKAGGSAITLDAADIMVILDETYVDDEQQQLEGRIDNRQPERKIAPRSYYYLRSLGTIEEHIARRNAEAKARGAKLLDGSQLAKLGTEVLK